MKANTPTPLFLSYVKPHKPVTSQRLAHWINDTLKKAWIDTDKFKAHSMQGASTSAATVKGLHVADVLKMADWSRESTFRQFYYLPSRVKKKYAELVLSN